MRSKQAGGIKMAKSAYYFWYFNFRHSLIAGVITHLHQALCVLYMVCVCMLISMCCNAIQCILIKITDSRLASTSEKNNNHFSGIFLCYLHLPGPVPLPSCPACLAVCPTPCPTASPTFLFCLGLWLSSKNNSAHSVRKIMDVRPRLIS